MEGPGPGVRPQRLESCFSSSALSRSEESLPNTSKAFSGAFVDAEVHAEKQTRERRETLENPELEPSELDLSLAACPAGNLRHRTHIVAMTAWGTKPADPPQASRPSRVAPPRLPHPPTAQPQPLASASPGQPLTRMLAADLQ